MNVRQSSANAASRGRGAGRGRHHQGRNRSNSGGGGRGRDNGSGARPGGSGYTNNNAPAQSGGGGFNNNHASSGSSSNNRVRCQLCKKPGHEVMDCWHRYDEDYVPDARHVTAEIMEQGGDGTVWYADSGATDHVTNELDKLSMRER